MSFKLNVNDFFLWFLFLKEMDACNYAPTGNCGCVKLISQSRMVDHHWMMTSSCHTLWINPTCRILPKEEYKYVKYIVSKYTPLETGWQHDALWRRGFADYETLCFRILASDHHILPTLGCTWRESWTRVDRIHGTGEPWWWAWATSYSYEWPIFAQQWTDVHPFDNPRHFDNPPGPNPWILLFPLLSKCGAKLRNKSIPDKV